MRNEFEALHKELERGIPAVLATIVASQGSTPRKAGAMMVFRTDGTSCGSVGGGAVEHQTSLAAAAAFEQRDSFLMKYGLSDQQAAGIGMICGGEVEIYLQYLCPSSQTLGLCREVLQCLKQNNRKVLILEIPDDSREQKTPPVTRETWRMYISPSDKADGTKPSSVSYAFPLFESGVVYIFGGGHVAQELVPVLSRLDFRCIVLDDREEFACPEVFPQAWQTLVADLEDFGKDAAIGADDYVCIMTRGHLYDYYVQKQVMRFQPAYIGVMGSRNKIRIVTEKLLQDGFTRAEIEACHMPIGTDIGAETPAEIAISIAGELIAVRSRAKKQNLGRSI